MKSGTMGHCTGSMGIRGHSAGDIFPAVVMIQGCFVNGFKYYVLNHPKVDSGKGYESFLIAHAYALLNRG